MRLDIHTVLLQKVQTMTKFACSETPYRSALNVLSTWLATGVSHFTWHGLKATFQSAGTFTCGQSPACVSLCCHCPTCIAVQLSHTNPSGNCGWTQPGAGHVPASTRKCDLWESQNHLMHQNNFKYLSGTYSAEWVSRCIVSRPLSHYKTHMAFQLDGGYWGALSPILICNPGSY